MNSQLLLWSWKFADYSLVDNLIAKKLILPMFQLDAAALLRVRGGLEHKLQHCLLVTVSPKDCVAMVILHLNQLGYLYISNQR